MSAENLGEGGRVSDVGVERSGVRHTSALHPKFPLSAFWVLACVYLCSVPSFSDHNEKRPVFICFINTLQWCTYILNSTFSGTNRVTQGLREMLQLLKA